MSTPSALQREQTELGLMLERLSGFRAGALSIGLVVGHLEALLDELPLADERWRREFTEAWSALDAAYAAALERGDDMPTAAEGAVGEAAERLEALVRDRLGVLARS